MLTKAIRNYESDSDNFKELIKGYLKAGAELSWLEDDEKLYKKAITILDLSFPKQLK